MRERGPIRPLTVVGAGRVGLTAAVALSEAAVPVTLAGRARDRPSHLEGFPGIDYLASRGSSAAESPLARSDLLFAVPDDALPGVVREWVGRLEGGEGGALPVAAHTSGVLPAGVLAPLGDLGYAPGTWHPLTALSAPRARAGAFEGVSFGISGSARARARATGWTRRVGGRPLRVRSGAEAGYHAAAVFGSNWLASCLSVAEQELAAATGGEGGLEDLLPLARAVLEELAARGLPEGATGPVARGDAGTVERHLEALDDRRADLYRALARELLERVGTGLRPGVRDRIRRILEED